MKHVNVFHADSGHGWLEVTLNDICELGIADTISSYSYVDVNVGFVHIKVFLEEDCDASKYFEAYKAKYGKLPKIKQKYYNDYAQLRNLPSYYATPEVIELQNCIQNHKRQKNIKKAVTV